MKCKSCNVDLSDREVAAKDKVTGEYLDLCTECKVISGEAVFLASWDVTESIDIPPDPMSPVDAFGNYVAQHRLIEQWGDGLGLMSRADRIDWMYNRAWEHFVALNNSGIAQFSALEEACGNINSSKYKL
jgi:hypothetical protein